MLRAASILFLAVFVISCDRSDSLQSVSSNTATEPDLMTRKCGVCHAVPNPAAHTADEWPGVIARMQHRRSTQGFALLTDNEVVAITEILQKSAKQ